MRHTREIPDFLMPTIETLESIESNTIIEEEMDIKEDALKGALDGLSRVKEGAKAINVIPDRYGVPGPCHEVLLVLVYASNTSATGITSIKGIAVSGFEELINKAREHLSRCHETKGIVFWVFSSWHPYVWARHRHQFDSTSVALKISGSDPVMI
jgi:hypothetical protein